MKLPSQKYRNALSDVINDYALWRTAWMKEEAGTTKCARYRVWFIEAKMRLLAEFGIQMLADDTVESLQAELDNAIDDLEICKMYDQRKEEQERKEAQERALLIESESKAYAEIRPELEAIGSSINPEDYVCIALWGQELGSYAGYIEMEQIKASNDGAPLTALFKRANGTWATLQEMENLPLKEKLEAQLAEELAA